MGYYVYFYYNVDDDIIYVGQALDVGKRWQSHNEKWKEEVVKIGVRTYPDHASIDIFEHYYIVKYNPRYNKALLQHGVTTLELVDTHEIQYYLIEEFKETFCPTIPRPEKKRKVPPTYICYDDKLKNDGIQVVYADRVDFFDPDILKLDLTNTWFRYEDKMYFSLGRFYMCGAKKDDTSFSHSNALLLLQTILDETNRIGCDTYAYPSTYKDPSDVDLVGTSVLSAVSFYCQQISKYKSSGREYLTASCSFGIDTRVEIPSSHFVKNQNFSYKIRINTREYPFIHLTPEKYEIDFAMLYDHRINKKL